MPHTNACKTLSPAKRKLIFWLAFACVVFYGALSLAGLASPCFFYNIIGMPCPGCGMSRSLRALAAGRIGEAFFCHPLFLLPPLTLLLFYLRFVKSFKIPNAVWILLAVLFIGVYIARLCLFFPHTKPMDFNPQALFPALLRDLSEVP